MFRTCKVLLTLFALLLTPLVGLLPATAQPTTSDVAIVATEDGQSIFDACFVLVNYSNEGCDENQDGQITFQDVPVGTYTLQQTRDLGAGRSIPDSTISVTGAADGDGWERFYVSVSVSSSGSSSTTNAGGMVIGATACDNAGSCWNEIGASFTVTTEGGEFLGSCSVTGDRNDTSHVAACAADFAFQPSGTVVVTLDLDSVTPGYVPEENPIYVDVASIGMASHDAVFHLVPQDGGSTGTGGQSGGAVDISLITREPEKGRLLTGTCYVLVNFSNEGCDENGDGQVTFEAVPFGTYTVQQTSTPAGYSTIRDFEIVVDTDYPSAPIGYLVRQATDQNAPNTRNVSVVFIDSATGTKASSSTCVEFVNGSNVGCDRDLIDGQIDFLDLPLGSYDLSYTNIPAGWQVPAGANPLSSVTVSSGTGPLILFVPVSTTGGSSGGNSGTNTEMGAIEVVGGEQTTTVNGGSSGGNTSSPGVAVELILDTSDSMNERDQGTQTRLEVAKSVTTDLVNGELPVGVPMALRTYNGCNSSLAIPLQPLDPASATSTIGNLRASGKTPIAQSLRAAGNDLEGVSGPKIIVLVTDGDETCGGDPQAAIEELVAQDIDVQVNIVGFAIDNARLTATFQEWAAAGNGSYYQASDEVELGQAISVASQFSYQVFDAQGTIVAEGVVGGDAVAVPAGTYSVEVSTNPVTRFDDVVVVAQQTTTLDLDAGTSSGSGGGQIIQSPSDSTGSGSRGDDTWTVSFQVQICDAGPTNCRAQGGIVFNIALASGEYLGSCTSEEPKPTPWGGMLSACGIEGMPYHSDFVAWQEPSSIPAGYAPLEETQTLHVDDIHPGGGDGAIFGFTNIAVDQGNTITSSTGSATLLMTFRGCPDGFDPNTDDFYALCTIPLDAPDASFLYHGGDGQGGQNIMWLDRMFNGEYVFEASSMTMNIQLTGLAPVVRNGYTVIGADSDDGSTFTINLVDGETREIYVFYYYV